MLTAVRCLGSIPDLPTPRWGQGLGTWSEEISRGTPAPRGEKRRRPPGGERREWREKDGGALQGLEDMGELVAGVGAEGLGADVPQRGVLQGEGAQGRIAGRIKGHDDIVLAH